MDIKKHKIHDLVKLVFFWLLYFALFRLLFIIVHFGKIPQNGLLETPSSFYYALPLDLSMACYLITLPFIFWSVFQFFPGKIILQINKVYHVFFIVLVCILSISNIKMYGEWGTLLSARALNYLLYPKEVLTFITPWAVFLLLATCGTISYIAIKSYLHWIGDFSAPANNKIWTTVQILLIPGLLVLGYRGGWQLAPINESNAYYSSTSINNHIATNQIWYVGHSIKDAKNTENPFVYMDPALAKKIKEDIYLTTGDSTPTILKNTRPNIVFIVLESWTADVIQALGGEKGVTPFFDELRKEGLLFTQMYGSGFRTDQGLVSIMGGFPAQPNTSIMKTPAKAEKLPSLNKELEKQGYHSSFYYGGEIEFANMKSYLINAHCTKIIDKNNFEKKEMNSKWGAHDEFVLQKQIRELNQEKQPFFSIALTLSTHEPFEVPMNTPFNGHLESEKFKKAAYYTDQCLARYFYEAKKQPWYRNTVFVLVADHGHRLPLHRNMDYPEGRKIAALITGGALLDSYRGQTVDKICSHHDWPAILLSQMKLPHHVFTWSNDVLNPSTKAFAYYSNENVLGWITPQQNIVYSFAAQKVTDLQPKTQSTLNDTLLTQGKAYLQTLYQEYLDY